MELSGLTSAALVLGVAFLGGLVSRRLKIPLLVGYIAAGALIGPGFLGIQEHGNEIRWFAELGIMLLMFVLGLELDIKRFQHTLKIALPIAILQVAAGLAVVGFVAYVLGWATPIAVLLGFVISLSSTAVGIDTLRQLNIMNTETARLTIGILIAQDILVIPMLLTVSAFGGGIGLESASQLGFSLLLIAASLAGIYYLESSPKVARQFERFFLASAVQPAIASMALCFGAAALSFSLGLSSAYGAFAAGLLIGNVGAAGAAFREAIQPIRELLLAIFFLSVGLLFDIRFILDHALEMFLLLAAVLFLKTILNFALLRFFGAPLYRAHTAGAVLSPIGEFAFVLIALGLSSGFIGAESYQIALGTIALSLVVSPLWLYLVRTYLRQRGLYFTGDRPQDHVVQPS